MMFLNCYYSDDLAQTAPPKPKPRQRTFGKKLQTVDKMEEDAESQELSRAQTSSTSIPLCTDTSSHPEEERMTSRSDSEQWQLRGHNLHLVHLHLGLCTHSFSVLFPNLPFQITLCLITTAAQTEKTLEHLKRM